jgi:adenosylcobalamin-dependent ribonucleoside-triphosphate reductase
LLQGCGVGFEPIVGTLSGFTKPVKLSAVPSENTHSSGLGTNEERFISNDDGTLSWHLYVGDSSKAWAKAIGKIVTMKKPVDEIVLRFTRIRKPGSTMSQYGWTSDGDLRIRPAFLEIAKILNLKSGELLTRIDILDIMNWLGTTLSSRRAAEICLVPSDDEEALDFANAKAKVQFGEDYHRSQSNNSLVFWNKPRKLELYGIFQTMLASGGSEPGFINGAAAKKRAPWFKGVNPCAEILLGNKSFCNLFEVDMAKFCDLDEMELYDAVKLAARANYRQTCVNLKDGMLSDQWHETNEYLRLCGVGLTGLVAWLDHLQSKFKTHGGDWYMREDMLQACRSEAWNGAVEMADELNLPHPKAVTTVKPSGTLGKIMDTTEGLHRPKAKFIFNNVNFSKTDPVLDKLRAANYHVFDNPFDPHASLVRLPVCYENVNFTEVNGLLIDDESAVEQLDRYKLLMDNYVDHNASITVSYRPEEIPAIVDWLDANWDTYVGVSFILRQDVTKTAADLGYAYLPQEVVTEKAYREYVSNLLPVDLDADEGTDMIDDGGCAGGACPIR